MGFRLVVAVKSYQSLHNLPGTGLVDRDLFDLVMKRADPGQ